MEVVVLTMLATPTMTRWELPEKYQSDRFVIDMLVSCRHRYSSTAVQHYKLIKHQMSSLKVPEAQRCFLLVEAVRGRDDVQSETERPADQAGAASV